MNEKKKVGRRPKDRNDRIFNMLRPRSDIEAVLDYGRKVAQGENPNPNVGIASKEEYAQLAQAQRDAAEAGKVIPSIPALYQPIIVGNGVATGARFITAGQKARNKTKPDNWPADEEWQEGYRLSDTHRRCHKNDARDLVVDREKNVLTLNGVDYVVGDETMSAVFMINGSKTGNYGHNLRCGKSVSFGGVDVANLVGQFNPEFRVENVDDGTSPGTEIAWGPNMSVDWGYLIYDDHRLSGTEIRNLPEGATPRFEKLDTPIVGESFNKEQLWEFVEKTMNASDTVDKTGETALARFKSRQARSEEKGNPADNAWRNILVQCRTSPHELFPFGFFSAQTGVVPVRHYCDDNTKEECVRFVVGVRVGANFAENLWQARHRVAESQEAAPIAETETVVAE